MKRVSVLAHYDKQNIVDDYVYYYLGHLKKIYSSIVFVTTSQIGDSDIVKLKRICDSVIIRENIGYDFMSWRTGIEAIANIMDYDELVICNDSVYGPIYPLEDVLNVMDTRDCDFWGITDSHEIAYHLQSYFLVFKKKVIVSDSFKKFWSSIQNEVTVDDVINKYEVGLTQLLLDTGYKPGTYAPYSFSFTTYFKLKASTFLKKPLHSIKIILSKRRRVLFANPTHYFWENLIEKQKVPFIKVKLLRDNPTTISIKGYSEILRKHSNYDPELIQRHLERVK